MTDRYIGYLRLYANPPWWLRLFEAVFAWGEMRRVLRNPACREDLRKILAAIESMTPQERQQPGLIDGNRASRIAAGSGALLDDVQWAMIALKGARHVADNSPKL